MTVRDELERVLRMLADAYTADSTASWEAFDDEATELLVRHGPALLEALADAERGKWVIDSAAWIRRDGVTVMEITLPEGVNLSSWGCRRDAIDRARGGE